MQKLVDSSDRKPAEYAAFGLAAFGNILAAAGLVTTTVWVALLGVVFMLIGAVVLLAFED